MKVDNRGINIPFVYHVSIHVIKHTGLFIVSKSSVYVTGSVLGIHSTFCFNHAMCDAQTFQGFNRPHKQQPMAPEQECRLPSGVAILSDTSADAWPRTSREKFTNMKTHTYTRPTRGLYSVLCLSLVLNHCKIKGVNFQKNIEWPCRQNIEKSRCQENLHVHINTVSLSLCFIFNV